MNSEDYLVSIWDKFKCVIQEAFTVDDKSNIDAIIFITTMEKRDTSKIGIWPEASLNLF